MSRILEIASITSFRRQICALSCAGSESEATSQRQKECLEINCLAWLKMFEGKVDGLGRRRGGEGVGGRERGGGVERRRRRRRRSRRRRRRNNIYF